jgi:hypothetical protein
MYPIRKIIVLLSDPTRSTRAWARGSEIAGITSGHKRRDMLYIIRERLPLQAKHMRTSSTAGTPLGCEIIIDGHGCCSARSIRLWRPALSSLSRVTEKSDPWRRRIKCLLSSSKLDFNSLHHITFIYLLLQHSSHLYFFHNFPPQCTIQPRAQI